MSLPTSPGGNFGKRVRVKDCYRTTCEEGDIVRMPSGTIAVITRLKFFYPVGEAVRLYPLTNWFLRFFLTLFGRNWVYDTDINLLKPIYRAPRT